MLLSNVTDWDQRYPREGLWDYLGLVDVRRGGEGDKCLLELGLEENPLYLLVVSHAYLIKPFTILYLHFR